VNFALTEEQIEFKEAVIRFARKELVERETGHDSFFSAWKKCAAFGLQGLPVAEPYGGGGADNLTIVAALEALGYSCFGNGLIFALNAQMWACQYPIERFGTSDQKERYLPRLCDGSLIAAHAMSEPGSGSDAFGLVTTATPTSGGYLINGSKTFVTNAPVADLFVVFARAPSTDGFSGLSCFLIERNTPGLTVGPPMRKMGLKTSQLGELFFDDSYVESSTLLGRFGAGMAVFTAAMERERSMILASTLGTMHRGLERSLA
jgi:alkylation response protein AidB-like acyl-CoA dehydrogenase